MDLAVVTVSYNTRHLLADCLASVMAGLEESSLTGSVWVVDNASADHSAEMVRERFPEVHLIASKANMGFAAGNNLGLRSIGLMPGNQPPVWDEPSNLPRHVLFLNPDTRVEDNALGTLVRFLDAHPLAGAAGARLTYGDGSFQHSAFAFPGLTQIFLDFFPLHHWLLDSRLNGRYPQRLYKTGQPFKVDHPLGAALMVRGETLLQVGGFDESYFMYCEEIDLCRRIWDGGWQVFCVPQAEIVHLEGQSTRQFRDRMFVALWRSRFLMFDKHQGIAFRWAARRLVRAGMCAKIRQARAAYRDGSLSSADLETRLRAYAEVASL
jgi:GT2 family glycosyltransferase